MFDWLLSSDPPAAAALGPGELATRLIAALLLGLAVAGVYRLSHGRRKEDARVLFATLVLLSLLIAMVALVIGNSVARAFSLVGALSIVRFRTVVDDTRDTAFVIFSVVAGMAAGAGLLFVPLLGMPLVAATAIALDRWHPRSGAAFGRGETDSATASDGQSKADNGTQRYIVQARIGAGFDPHAMLEPVLDRCEAVWRLRSLGTARQGTVLDCVYAVRLGSSQRLAALLLELNRVEGVQSLEAVAETETRDNAAAG